jgi:hypothetical protein
MMSKIFISYRREETAPYAGRLYDRLAHEFGQDRVFMDISAIDPGVDFVEAIEKAVAEVDVLVCVMGPEWATITNSRGERRLDDQNDFVRLEVLSALKRDIRVVPVLVGGAIMTSAEQLPSDLEPLARRNALPLDDARFHTDLDRLIESIRSLLPVTESSVEPPAKGKREKKSKAGRWLIASLVAVLLGVGGTWFVWHKDSQTFKKVERKLKAVEPLPIEKREIPRKADLTVKRENSRKWSIPGTDSTFTEKNGHLVSVASGKPLCPTPPGWRTGCYALEPKNRQNWHNTPDGFVANGKKLKTFSNRSERVFHIPGTKHAFYVDDGHLFYYPTATILCPWPKGGVGKCHKIDSKYEAKWRNTPQGFIADGRKFDAIEVMRDDRQGLF